MTNKPTATEDTSMATPAKWEEEFALDIFDMGSYTTIENEELLSYIKQNFHHKSESVTKKEVLEIAKDLQEKGYKRSAREIKRILSPDDCSATNYQ